MSEYWVSGKKYYCEYCRLFIADNAAQRKQHEGTARHKNSMQQFLVQQRKQKRQEAREQQALQIEMARIEQAAAVAHENLDVDRNFAVPSGQALPLPMIGAAPVFTNIQQQQEEQVSHQQTQVSQRFDNRPHEEQNRRVGELKNKGEELKRREEELKKRVEEEKKMREEELMKRYYEDYYKQYYQQYYAQSATAMHAAAAAAAAAQCGITWPTNNDHVQPLPPADEQYNNQLAHSQQEQQLPAAVKVQEQEQSPEQGQIQSPEQEQEQSPKQEQIFAQPQSPQQISHVSPVSQTLPAQPQSPLDRKDSSNLLDKDEEISYVPPSDHRQQTARDKFNFQYYNDPEFFFSEAADQLEQEVEQEKEREQVRAEKSKQMAKELQREHKRQDKIAAKKRYYAQFENSHSTANGIGQWQSVSAEVIPNSIGDVCIEQPSTAVGSTVAQPSNTVAASAAAMLAAIPNTFSQKVQTEESAGKLILPAAFRTRNMDHLLRKDDTEDPELKEQHGWRNEPEMSDDEDELAQQTIVRQYDYNLYKRRRGEHVTQTQQQQHYHQQQQPTTKRIKLDKQEEQQQEIVRVKREPENVQQQQQETALSFSLQTIIEPKNISSLEEDEETTSNVFGDD